MNPEKNRLPTSYRDPAGFVFEEDGVIYRQINQCYKPHYEHLMASGLYAQLTDAGMLIQHEEVTFQENEEVYKIIRPKKIQFISTAENWCHSQFRAAAVLILDIQKMALGYGMSLKDATPSNIQFIEGRCTLIDTLSFQVTSTNKPWKAYRQFCETFLAPLALSHYVKIPIRCTSRAWPAGVGIRVASSLLPLRSYFNIHILLNLHMQSLVSRSVRQPKTNQNTFSEKKHQNVLSSLQSAINSCKATHSPGEWATYYDEVSSRANYLEEKEKIIRRWINQLPEAERGLDLGANTGFFTKILAEKCKHTIAVDNSEQSIEILNHELNVHSLNNGKHILPLVIEIENTDLSSGSPLSTITQNRPYNLVLALAIMHHLVIGKSIPIKYVVELLQELTNNILIFEFIPTHDPLSILLIEQKEGIYHAYDQQIVEKDLSVYFNIEDKVQVGPTQRVLYKLIKKSNVN